MTENVKKESLAFEAENELLNASMLEIEATEDGKVLINGKYYTKVSKRLQILRQKLGFNFRVETSLLHLDQSTVVAKATISIYREGSWFEVSSGHAEEVRTSSEINKYAAVENAETSAIGRALAGIGLSGDEYASLEEMLLAQNRKSNDEQVEQKSDKKTEGNSASKKKEPPISEPMVEFITKLMEKTSTDKNLFLKHFAAEEINFLTMAQGKEAISLLKKKEEKLKLLEKTATSKAEQNDAISILQENEANSKKTFTSINLDEGTESERLVNTSKKVEDDILMDDDEEEVDATEQEETSSDKEDVKVEQDEKPEEVKEDSSKKSDDEVQDKKDEKPVKKTGRKASASKKTTTTKKSSTAKKTTTSKKSPTKGRKTTSKKEDDKKTSPSKPKKDDLNDDDDITL